MNIAEMASHVCAKVGQTDEESVAACKGFLDRRYRMIWDSALWRDSLTLFSLQTTANSPWLLMPAGIERVLKLRLGDSHTLPPFETGSVFDYQPGVFETFGAGAGFATFAPVVMGPIESTTVLHLTNTDLFAVAEYEFEDGRTYTDTQVPLRSEAGYEIVCTWLLRFDKPVTDYFVSLSGGPSILPNQTSADRRARIRLLNGPSAQTPVLALCKRACQGLVAPGVQTIGPNATGGQPLPPQDEQAPLLRNIDNALLASAQADMLERQRQYNKAQMKAQEGQAQLQLALDLEKNQSACEQRIIPAEIHAGMGPCSYGTFGAFGKEAW
jgi:hypothetical protein